ncbi:hypothetical protein IFVP408_C2120307 [Vibrio parahaemolyticus]
MDVFRFELIPGTKVLSMVEKIPSSTLCMMEKFGYMPFDVKPDNFMKVLNANNQYDYLPIDAKQIGKFGSNSMRT